MANIYLSDGPPGSGIMWIAQSRQGIICNKTTIINTSECDLDLIPHELTFTWCCDFILLKVYTEYELCTVSHL